MLRYRDGADNKHYAEDPFVTKNMQLILDMLVLDQWKELTDVIKHTGKA